MVVNSTGVDAFTDALKNKNTVALSALAPGAAAQSFTDYVLDASGPVDYTANLAIPGGGLMLANIVADGGESLTVTRLVAPASTSCSPAVRSPSAAKSGARTS